MQNISQKKSSTIAFRGEGLQRTELIRQLRLGEFDVLVGINLLREGLDIPEVSLVAVLDADKEGFLRNFTRFRHLAVLQEMKMEL